MSKKVILSERKLRKIIRTEMKSVLSEAQNNIEIDNIKYTIKSGTHRGNILIVLLPFAESELDKVISKGKDQIGKDLEQFLSRKMPFDVEYSRSYPGAGLGFNIYNWESHLADLLR